MRQEIEDSGIDKALMDVITELTPPQTIGLTEAQSEIVLGAYKNVFHEYPHCPHNIVSADEESGYLRMDTSPRAMCRYAEIPFLDFIGVFVGNKVKNHFQNVHIHSYEGAKSLNGVDPITCIEPIEAAQVVFLLLELDEQGQVIDGAYDIELVVNWDKHSTKTKDFQVIEALCDRIPAKDFTLEELEKSLKKIY